MPCPTLTLAHRFPPFTRESAIEKVRLAEDGWNSRDADKVSLAYSLDTQWRNRAEFTNGREEARQFLARKWNKELEYRLIKELWAFTENRIAVRYAYEWRDDSGNWFRSYGNENWEFGADGLMERRFSCINDMPIKESDRKFTGRWAVARTIIRGCLIWVCRGSRRLRCKPSAVLLHGGFSLAPAASLACRGGGKETGSSSLRK